MEPGAKPSGLGVFHPPKVGVMSISKLPLLRSGDRGGYYNFFFFLSSIRFAVQVQTYVSLCQTRLPNHSDGFSLKPNTPGKNINSSSSFDVRAQNNELQVTIRVCSILASSPGWEPLSTTSLSGALSAKPSMPLSGFLTHFIIFEQQFDPHFVSPFGLRHVCQV